MRKNITVFVFLILIASSFKYRVKTREAVPMIVTEIEGSAPSESASVSDFQGVIRKMQIAHEAMAAGDAEPVKALWSRNDDVAIHCDPGGMEVFGWDAVNTRLNWNADHMPIAGKYTYETISSHQGDEFGSLQQTEHYTGSDGSTRDLAVTVVFRKESSGWKIMNRRAERLNSRIALHSGKQ